VRHELTYAMDSPLTQFAQRLCNGDKDLEAVLNSHEEQLVTAISQMPIWDEIE